jgi:hypothetical protein
MGPAKLVDTSKLLSDEKASAAFDSLVHSEQPPARLQGMDLHPVFIPFWRERIAELELRGDQEGLFVLAHILAVHVPMTP